MPQRSSQAHLDTLAQQLGFKNYAQYSAYQAHQAMMRQGPAVAPVQRPAAPPQAPPQNWLQHLLSYLPFNRSMDAAGNAMR